jgi:cytochrome c-type biogenesis protein CcmH
MMKAILARLVMLTMFASSAFAVLPDEMLKDTTLEARARALSATLRCLVCQNESIDESEAPLARDLRILIRQQLMQNKSDTEIEQFLTARYGEYILLKPPLTPVTFVAWFAPFVLLAGAGIFLWQRRAKSEPTNSKLSEDEEAALQSALKNPKDN